LKIRPLAVGPLQENCYLVIDEAAGDAVLIDPGAEGERLLRAVEDEGAELRAIWLTHAHMDHVGGIAAIVRRSPVPIYLHPDERELYDHAAEHGALFGVPVEQPPPPDRSIAEGDTLRVGALEFVVMHLPGHAPGHVAFAGQGVMFVGDVLFAGSVGRTDLPFCDSRALTRSLGRLSAMPDETEVYPGHGPQTTIGRERESNPFLRGAVRLVDRGT
jgi:glyoxylase-like metal-dependent hydrolase (beta-lactamase superfamily II)